MVTSTTFDRDWVFEPASFSAKEVTEIVGLSKQLLRLWRSRGYLPEKDKGKWSIYNASEVVDTYLLFALSKLGVAPSEASRLVPELSTDLLFFVATSGDGACDFVGPRNEVEILREAFDRDMRTARVMIRPNDESRYVVSDGSSNLCRHSDLGAALENEMLEYFFSIDLVTAGRRIVERAKRPLLSFVYQGLCADTPMVRRLSHGQNG